MKAINSKLLLAIYLIAVGAVGLLGLGSLVIVLHILAIVTGVLMLMGK